MEPTASIQSISGYGALLPTSLSAQGTSANALQVLKAAYTAVTTSSADPLAALAGSAPLTSLVAGIYGLSDTGSTLGADPMGLFAGSTATSASTADLLGTLGSGGLDGFSPDALSQQAILAMTAYGDRSTSAASSSAASTTSSASLVAAAQASMFQTTLDLLS